MVVFLLKPSYLNWRVIPYKRRKSCVYAIFFFDFFFESSFLDFRLDSIEFLKCIRWQSNPFFFAFIIFSHDLSTSGNNVYYRWLSKLKHHFSCRNYFERVIFWSKGCSCHFIPKKGLWLKRLFTSFLSARKGLWLKSVFEKWTISFLVNAPQDIH